MPAALHRRLERQAIKAGLKPGTERFDAYVYGTLSLIEARSRARNSPPRVLTRGGPRGQRGRRAKA